MPEWPVRLNPTVEAALNDIQSEDERSRLAATSTLANAKGDQRPAALEALTRALSDRSPKVRAQAALALAELGPPRGSFERLQELALEADGQVAQAAVIALGEAADHDATPVLLRALTSDDGDVRFQAVLALARTLGAAAVEHLADLVDDRDSEVRANVAAALADLDAEEGIVLLERLLRDEEVLVRFEAALALARRGVLRVLPVLIEGLDDPDVAPQAVRALGLLGDARGIEPLRKLSRRWSTPAPLRAAISASLAALGDAEGAVELQRWLRARRREPRAMAIFAAGELKVASATERLVELIADRREPDRDSVARALGQLGDRRALEALRLAADDADPDLSEEARRALEALGEPR